MGVISKACYCCETDQPCCKMDSNEGITFTPDEGFTLESAEVTNTNGDGCVGRAKVDIVLSKPANPAFGCPSSDIGCGVKCSDGWSNGTYYPGGSNAAAMAIFDAWLAQIPVPDGWSFVGSAASGGYIAPVDGPHWNCNSVKLQVWGGSIPCSSPCGTTTSPTTLFRYTEYKCFATPAERDAYAVSKQVELEAAITAWMASAPAIEYQVGDCWYRLTPTAFEGYPGVTRARCIENKTSGTERFCICRAQSRYVPTITFSIECSQSPCSMADYDWPLTLDCGCTGEFEKPEVDATPVCKLYFDTSSHEYAGDKCLFKATYKGAIENGTIDCEATPNTNDCRCCSEGP